jgi:nicotinate phosphoribosyltransferase
MRSRSAGASPNSPRRVNSRCGWIPPAGAIAKGSIPPYEVIERHAPQSILGYRTEEELRYLVGTGVSGAAIWLMRQKLDEAGLSGIKIVASSGFGPAKCRMMAAAHAPIDVIGTGSYLPELWSETYATADIIAYDGKPMVKAGREFLLRKRGEG